MMDVLCVGHAAWDISVFVAGFPAENSKSETRTMIEGGGGPAANAACLLARWGVRCALAASVGDDTYGKRLARELADAGADLAWLDRSAENSTPVSVILVNERNGSRTVINRQLSRAGKPLRLPGESPPQGANWAPAPRVLLFDGHELKASLDALRLFPQARTILDAGSLRPGTRELARRVDFLVCSEKFAREYSGVPDLDTAEHRAAAVGALHRCNGHPVVVTCGERGVLHGTRKGVQRLPALPVKVRDTTGAGDIFHGAFAYGILKGMPWRKTLQLAIVAASLSVMERGGRASIPSLAKVQETLRHVG
jgi:sugar/nucleoside kinase (ribokinase family)